ncbi:PAS domain S-box protein [Magnetospira sp. QH-2]|uniref:PAS domain S-box protein n=1 Tax=Magnetospira sp. (strain QH-2) TaxID=1288970 RepID=UPI0003E81395|nr:PAS domain S-box protein [Magnetospira sp. QH-2]CCQ74319.1 putative MCP methyltransferase/methylesterase, putative chemotaxis CheB/CheR fusion protein [Magnetospira sp. QH-2]
MVRNLKVVGSSQPDDVTTPEKQKPTHYVGIGASAGGLEAIQSLFKGMDPDSGLSFIVVQHLSPDYKSLMAELVAKMTTIPVYRAENEMAVEPNCIYLIPPKKNLKIFHGKLLLMDQDRSPTTVNLPIDIFLNSLAEDQENKAIAIILSGTGSDGTRGCRMIKELGGMVMVQDEATAKFDSMPKSVIAGGLPDFILPPEDMPSQLMAYVKHPISTREARDSGLLEDKTGLTRIFSLLRERSKIDFTFYKPNTVVRRIERRMTVNQVESLDDYVRFLELNKTEQGALYQELLIGVTNFFRDPDVFDLLREKFLPEMLEEAQGRELRVWVAGCSTGEEAYTYAIAFREVMENIGKSVDVKIFATDVDQDAIMRASTGVFSEGVSADIPPALLSKYFFRKGDDYRIVRQIREMVVFAKHNLIKDPPFTNIDIISCRNLLIYLQQVLQHKVMESMNFSLKPNGILVLGTSESIGEAEIYFEPVSNRWKIFRSKGSRKSLISSDRFSITGQYRPPSFPRPATAHSSAQQAYEEERTLGRLLEALAEEDLPFMIVVNDRQEIVHVIGDTRHFLVFPSGKMVNDVTKAVVRELAIPLSTGLSKSFNSGKEVSFTNMRITNTAGEKVTVNARVKPLPEQRGKDRLAVVMLSEAKDTTPRLPQAESSTYDVSREAEQRIADLEQELQFTRENLQASIEELETSNEELQATNEELVASNEELQSTNEELQSVNEELITVNAEYQSKITELSELTSDLDNFVDSTKVISIFLDENLDVRRFTASASRVINVLDTDTGRPFGHLSHRLRDCDLLEYAQRVNDGGEQVSREVMTETEEWFQLRVLPYQISNHVRAGVVIVLNEIDDLKKIQNTLRETTRRYELAQLASNIGAWEWNVENNDLYWSANIETMFGYKKGQFPGNYDAFLNTIHPEDRNFVQSSVASAVKGNSDYNIEHRILYPDGKTVRWMSETGAVVRDEDGNAFKMYGVVRDVTERRQTEENLRASEARFRVIFDSSPIGILQLDMEGRPILTNRTLRGLLGYSDNEMAHLAIRDITYPDDLENDMDPFDQLVRGERDHYETEKRYLTKDGSIIWADVSVSLVRDDHGEPSSIIKVIDDMTERHKFEHSLKISRAAMERAPEAFFLIDEDSTILDVNEMASSNLGYEREELIGLKVADISSTEWTGESWKKHWADLSEKGTLVFQSHHKARDGSLVPVEVAANIIMIDGTPMNCAFARRIEGKGL